MGDDISMNSIISKMSLLVLHFPRLRIVWSRSLHATAEIFSALKSNQDEPDVAKAMRVGVPTEDGLIEGDVRWGGGEDSWLVVDFTVNSVVDFVVVFLVDFVVVFLVDFLLDLFILTFSLTFFSTLFINAVCCCCR